MKRLLNRLFWSVITLLCTAVLTFFLVNVVPGDVARVIAGSKASPDVIKEIHAKFHLDDPVWKRLGYYFGELARGDLGKSYVTDQSVVEAILTRFPTTAALCATAVVMWMLLAVPLGVLTAKFRGSWFDRLVLVLGTIGLSLPAFWLARMLQYWLSYKLGWFPVAGFRSFLHLLLPAIALAILAIGYYARLIHTNMVEVLDSPSIRAARARGLPESAVLFKHALRNALMPIITIMGLSLPDLFGGAFIIETIFAWPGMGRLGVAAIFSRNYPLIMGIAIFSAVLIVLGNLLADIGYAMVDPRVRYGKE